MPSALLLLSALALAAPPTATRTTVARLPVHVTSPIGRTLSVECQDPDAVPPLSARCLVADVTAGALGSGDEDVLEDVDCGSTSTLSGAALLHEVTHAFDVPGALGGHRYAYAVVCTDGDAETGTFLQEGVYDDDAPVLELLAGPRHVTFASTAEFDATCADASFDADWTFADGFRPRCTMTCAVYDRHDVQVVGPTACGTETVEGLDEAGHFVVRNLPPGRYRLELSGQDDVELEAEAVTWSWRVLPAPPDTGGWYDDTGWAVDDDTGWPWEVDDTDAPVDSDSDLPVVDTDDPDPTPGDTDLGQPGDTDADGPPGGCDCDHAGARPGLGALVALALALRRRSRRPAIG